MARTHPVTQEFRHRDHKIQYSYFDSLDGTFQPIAFIFDLDGLPVPLNIPSVAIYRTPQDACDRALIEGMAAIDKRCNR